MEKNLMFRVALYLVVFALCILFTGCAPSSESVQATIDVAIAQTQEAAVTNTPVATHTRTPRPTATNTLTPTPTNTATNTPTATVTNTPTSTLTPTLTPTPPGPVVRVNLTGSVMRAPSDDAKVSFFLKGDTPVAIIERNDDSSWYKIFLLDDFKTGWVPASRIDFTDDIEITEILVSTPAPTPTNTPIPTNTPDVRGEYTEIDIRELDAYPNTYIGEKIKLRGQVFNIMGDALQMWVRKPGGGRFDTVAVVVKWGSGSILPSQVYEDTWITVYGTGAGTFNGTNAYGGTITQPIVRATIIEKQ